MRFIYSALLILPLSSLLLAATPIEDLATETALEETSLEETSAPTTIITRLALRDYQITISAGADGATQYGIYAHSGQPIDTN